MAKKKEEPKVEKMYAIVTGDYPLNVRSGKTTEDNNVVGQLAPGTKVEILKDGKMWCKIEQGYIMRKFLVFE